MASPEPIFEKILEFKAMGWSDAQIQQELGITYNEFRKLLTRLRRSKHLKEKAIGICTETVHRLFYLRQVALTDYERWSNPDTKKNPGLKPSPNAAVGCLHVILKIEEAIPKICKHLGWKPDPDELDEKKKKKKTLEDHNQLSEDELYEHYRKLVGGES